MSTDIIQTIPTNGLSTSDTSHSDTNNNEINNINNIINIVNLYSNLSSEQKEKFLNQLCDDDTFNNASKKSIVEALHHCSCTHGGKVFVIKQYWNFFDCLVPINNQPIDELKL